MKANNKIKAETLPGETSSSSQSKFSNHSFVLRRGLKKNQEFLGLYSILRTLFPRCSSTFMSSSIRFIHRFRIVATLSTILLFALVLGALIPVTSDNTESAEATTGTATSSETTLSISTGDAIKLSLTPSSVKGTFASASSTITVSTNNYSGYDLKLSTRSDGEDNTSLVNTDDASSKFTTLSSTISQATFSAENNTTYNGKWGYNFYNNSGSSNTDYNPSPENTTGVSLDSPTGATSASGNTYTLSIGARAGLDLPAGTYSNTFIISAVAKAVTYNITYNSNGGSSVASTTGSTLDTSINLTSTVPTRDSYNFKGWCSTSTSDDTCSGTIYNPDGNGTNLAYGIDQTSDNTSTLYAMWKQSKIYMQTMAFDQCTTAGVTVYDSRNESASYKVKKITLNSTPTCWMMSNLKLPKTASITPDNSNVTSTYTALSRSGNWTSSSQDDYCKPYMAVKNGEYYYNWPAATARTNTTTGSSSCSNDTSNSVGDICPKGWRLPTYTETGNSTWRTNIAARGGLATTGYFGSGSRNQVGSYGYWWASTRHDDNYAYGFYFGGSSAGGDGSNYKRDGYSVRCLRTS